MDTYSLIDQENKRSFLGIEKEHCYAFYGIPFGKIEHRFLQAKQCDHLGESLDCTRPGPSVMQKRAYREFEHLEIPARAFYHKEFREGIEFSYDEEYLRLNIFTPKTAGPHPVIMYVYGGGFDSGSIGESSFDGEALARRGIIAVFISYRVGVFGYFTYFGLDATIPGNMGLKDILLAATWIKNNIAVFGGDPHSITYMGQSAGAMQIQYLLYQGYPIQKAIMMSGAGKFPNFSLPKPNQETATYWKEVMEIAGCSTLKEFQDLPAYDVLKAVEEQKKRRKDNTYNTMPVIDGEILKEPIQVLAKKEGDGASLMIGYTNRDMFTALLAHISKKYAKKHRNAYLYYFDVDAPGDDNQAFHSSDLRYAFGTLSSSWRPFTKKDYELSDALMDYIAAFAKSGNPNTEGLPTWETYRKAKKPMRFGRDEIAPKKDKFFRLLSNTFKGDPR